MSVFDNPLASPNFNQRVHDEVQKLAGELSRLHAQRLNTSIRQQLFRIISEMIESGDIVRHVTPTSESTLTYEPFRQRERLQKQIEELRLANAEMRDALQIIQSAARQFSE